MDIGLSITAVNQKLRKDVVEADLSLAFLKSQVSNLCLVFKVFIFLQLCHKDHNAISEVRQNRV